MSPRRKGWRRIFDVMGDGVMGGVVGGVMGNGVIGDGVTRSGVMRGGVMSGGVMTGGGFRMIVATLAACILKLPRVGLTPLKIIGACLPAFPKSNGISEFL